MALGVQPLCRGRQSLQGVWGWWGSLSGVLGWNQGLLGAAAGAGGWLSEVGAASSPGLCLLSSFPSPSPLGEADAAGRAVLMVAQGRAWSLIFGARVTGCSPGLGLGGPTEVFETHHRYYIKKKKGYFNLKSYNFLPTLPIASELLVTRRCHSVTARRGNLPATFCGCAAVSQGDFGGI